MRMIPKNYKKFQAYSYHRQFFFWNIKNKIPSPKLKFHIVLNGKKEEKLNKRMRKEKRCSLDFFLLNIFPWGATMYLLKISLVSLFLQNEKIKIKKVKEKKIKVEKKTWVASQKCFN